MLQTYASVAVARATMCSTGIGSFKENKQKSVGEICKYLIVNRLERTQFWRRVGGVLEFDEVALEQVMKKRAGQRP